MSDHQSNRQPPWEGDSEHGETSFGTWLRRQREIREIPLREIADVTKISIRYLEALEQDRFDVLPAQVFARGFLREYSKYVGLDPDEVVNSFLTAHEAAEEGSEASQEVRPREESWSRGLPMVAAVVVLILLLAAIYAAIRFWPRDSGIEKPPPIAAPVHGMSEPAAVADRDAGPGRVDRPLFVTMDFTEDCWVEVEVDGERRLSELHVQGESMRIEAQEAIQLRLGNPEGVHLEVNGKAHQLDLGSGRTARDVLIDLELARALEGEAG